MNNGFVGSTRCLGIRFLLSGDMLSFLYELRKLRLAIPLGLAALVLCGCASARESVQWEFNSEKVELEPHEQRRADADFLADPDNR